MLSRPTLVVGGRPVRPEPFPQPMNRGQLGGVMVTPARIAPAVQASLEGGSVTELFAVDPIAVDQRTCRTQCELGVMGKKHLTHDPFRDNVTTKREFTHY